MKTLLLLSVASGLFAQPGAGVAVQYTPEGDTVPAAILANLHGMNRYKIDMCNNDTVSFTIQVQRLDMAATGITFLDTDDATLVLTAAQSKTTAAKIVRIGQLAGQGAAIGLALASKANLSWAAGLGIGASVAPSVVSIAQGQVPSIVPLISSVTYPLTLAPGQCATDHRFAASKKKPVIVTATIHPMAVPAAAAKPGSELASFEMHRPIDPATLGHSRDIIGSD